LTAVNETVNVAGGGLGSEIGATVAVASGAGLPPDGPGSGGGGWSPVLAGGAYEGARISVPRWRWDAVVAELVEGRQSEAVARLMLLDEAEWSDDIAGVELLARCLHCREALPAGRTRFCDLVCEAAFYAEPHSE
jgi:hypothetical protein